MIPPIESEGSKPAILKQPIVWVLGLVLIGWLTAPWHGINETLIAILGALLITAPRFGVIGLKEALGQVDWNLLVFLAATISLAQTMVRTDLADQLLDGPFGDIEDVGLPPLLIAVIIAVVGMSLHLIVHSRTARVAVLLPPVLLLADEADLNPVAMMLVTVAATGFCQTLMVSAKSLIMFGKIDGVTYTQGDLLRLSAVLAPVHLALIILFVGVIWPWLGVDLLSGDG
jgi:di/tricarboxylate transporter